MKWQAFTLQLQGALMEAGIFYLLKESKTNIKNARDSQILCLELYKKLKGSALAFFSSMSAQNYYMIEGRGIEMVHALAAK